MERHDLRTILIATKQSSLSEGIKNQSRLTEEQYLDHVGLMVVLPTLKRRSQKSSAVPTPTRPRQSQSHVSRTFPPALQKSKRGDSKRQNKFPKAQVHRLTSRFRANMASSALNQELQALILQTLDTQSSISDTSKLVLPSSSQPVEQQLVQSVLTSLASRNVCVYLRD